MRVMRMLMGTLRPRSRGNREPGYGSEGAAIVAVGIVVILAISLAASTRERTTSMATGLLLVVVMVVEVEVCWRRRGRGWGRGGIHVSLMCRAEPSRAEPRREMLLRSGAGWARRVDGSKAICLELYWELLGATREDSEGERLRGRLYEAGWLSRQWNSKQ